MQVDRFGQLTMGTGKTILYSGRDDDQHMAGVALILKKGLKKALIEWQPVNERLIRAKFSGKHTRLSIIQCYAPTNDAADEDKDAFYRRLQEEVDKVPTHDVLCVMGDMNAKVGDNNTNRERFMGNHRCGDLNDNGERLSDFCLENRLIIGGTLFPHKTIHKLTWVSPNGKVENQIDHVLVNQKWRRSLFDVRACRRADVGSDHHLVKAVLKVKLRSNAPASTNRPTRYNLHLLSDVGISKEFSIEVRNRFQILEVQQTTDIGAKVSVEEKWSHVKEAYHSTSKNILGIKKRQHKE